MVGQEPEEYRPRRAWVEDPDDVAQDENSSEPDTGKPAGPADRRGGKPKIDDSLFRPGSKDGASDPSETTDDETRLSPRVDAAAEGSKEAAQPKKDPAQPKSDPAQPRSRKGRKGKKADQANKSEQARKSDGTKKSDQAGSSNDELADGSNAAQDASTDDDETRVQPAVAGGATKSGKAAAAAGSARLGSDSARSGSDDEATTVLPRTSRSEPKEDGETSGDIAPGSRLGPRSKMALLVGAVAAVVVLGLAVGYAVISLNGNQKVAGPGGGPATAASTDTSSAAPPEDSNVALNDASMLTSKDAKLIDPKRTWKVAQTLKGKGDDSPQPACTTNDPVEGQPQAKQTFLRTLTASGDKPPAVLHQAEAYATPDEATQAFTMASKALGGCAMDHAYIDSGVYLSGLGNQSTGVVVNIKDKQNQFRTVLLSRTGRVVNTVDVARDDKAVSADDVAKALGQVTNDQCTAAIGLCATSVKTSDGPPPIGGDQPGFLAAADIPPIDGQDGIWSGDTPGEVKDLFSQCEGVEFSTVSGATKRQARTYLLAENTDVPESFGLDQVILTMKSESEAKKLVTKVAGNLSSCSDRALTATVEDPTKISGTGSKGAKISGSVTTVSQKVNASNTATYRVGISRAGSKVIYSFLPSSSDFDFTDQQWQDLNVRAGERATQVK